tara:strand:- start:593 stop:817 length:225 start_codon:yes stop_codon:yes gene_type:complete
MADTQTILAVLLTISAGLLIWYILGLRQKRRMSDSEDSVDYSGMARNPEKLMEPDQEALEELDRLLSQEFDSEE